MLNIYKRRLFNCLDIAVVITKNDTYLIPMQNIVKLPPEVRGIPYGEEETYGKQIN